ncbi:hypothetical protein CO540_13335 [Micromonospora sp. WMMA2032]|nr:hypothetical protein CO540_13335 [Micromonospora sp. WMMA2032]
MRSVPESEWNDQQLALMVALEEYEDGQCRRCGHELAESTDPGNDYNNPFGSGFYAPLPGTPVQCHACAALERSEQQAAAGNPQHPGALMHAVHLVRRG